SVWMRASRLVVFSMRTTWMNPASRRPSSRIAERTGDSSTITILRDASIGTSPVSSCVPNRQMDEFIAESVCYGWNLRPTETADAARFPRTKPTFCAMHKIVLNQKPLLLVLRIDQAGEPPGPGRGTARAQDVNVESE